MRAQADSKIDVIVVSHTHWDREWYLTFEEFRYWLVQAMDRLLGIFQRQPDYRFMLDGQVIPGCWWAPGTSSPTSSWSPGRP